MQKKLLEGIKVVDFGIALAGPMIGKTLADYGAEVIRVEGGKAKIDGQRLLGSFRDNEPGVNRSIGWNEGNTGKLSLAINLSHPKGADVIKRLIASWADVALDNFAGGAMKRMGIGYEDLKKVKPDIIMLSTCMMGQTGPYAHHRGFGVPLTAMTGYYNLTGWPDRFPASIGFYTDLITPHFSAMAILAALDYRRRTGKGQYLDMSQYENGVHFLEPFALEYTVNGRVADRMGNRLDHAAPHGAYQCQGEDRWCAITVFTEEEWQSFCQVIGNPEWTNDPRFSTLQSRKDNEDELNNLVGEWTINHSAEDVMTRMQAAGVGAGVLQTPEDLLMNDPQFKHRHFYWELEHPEIGNFISPRSPCIPSKATCELQRAPLLGEHNYHILKDIIGMSDEEVTALVTEEVIE